MSLSSLCNSWITVRRPIIDTDAYGGEDRTSRQKKIYAKIPASIQPVTGALVEEFAQMRTEVSHVIYTPRSVEMKAGDLITDKAGKMYLFKHHRNMAGRGTVHAIYCLLKDQG